MNDIEEKAKKAADQIVPWNADKITMTEAAECVRLAYKQGYFQGAVDSTRKEPREESGL